MSYKIIMLLFMNNVSGVVTDTTSPHIEVNNPTGNCNIGKLSQVLTIQNYFIYPWKAFIYAAISTRNPSRNAPRMPGLTDFLDETDVWDQRVSWQIEVVYV